MSDQSATPRTPSSYETAMKLGNEVDQLRRELAESQAEARRLLDRVVGLIDEREKAEARCRELELIDNKCELLSEDIEAFHMAMDKEEIPRTDASGKTFSMYGRALVFKARYRWLADKVIAPDYGDNDSKPHQVGYLIKHCKGPSVIYGKSLDAAIDAAIAREGESNE